jgi:hypothetical protein
VRPSSNNNIINNNNSNSSSNTFCGLSLYYCRCISPLSFPLCGRNASRQKQLKCGTTATTTTATYAQPYDSIPHNEAFNFVLQLFCSVVKQKKTLLLMCMRDIFLTEFVAFSSM